MAALPSATLFYVANVLLHVVLGLAGVVVLCWQWRRSPKIAALVGAALLGGFLVVKGAVTDNRWVLWMHVALGVVGLAILLPRGRWRTGFAALAILAAVLRFGTGSPTGAGLACRRLDFAGLGELPVALLQRLFTGDHDGKLLIQVSPEP